MVITLLGWIPALVVVHVPVVGVVCPVADPPPVVGDHDGRVGYVSDDVVEGLVVTEAAVPAVVPDHEERPEHGPLREPVERPNERVVERHGGGGERGHDDDVLDEVEQGLAGLLLPQVLGDGLLDVLQREGRRLAEVLPVRVVREGLGAGLHGRGDHARPKGSPPRRVHRLGAPGHHALCPQAHRRRGMVEACHGRGQEAEREH
mmetsp:Transcript_28739/g.71217  ORF Transcript_28739/g.71217 Transcript_28739/m.71217 type:complete len:204 (+) Transcript_28739:938-1549(+)